MSSITNLIQKQRRFIDEYIISGNATQAAIKAGYSKKTARKIGQVVKTLVFHTSNTGSILVRSIAI